LPLQKTRGGEEQQDISGSTKESKSGVTVDKLTVSQISVETEGKDNRAWLAFLSPCSTAEVTVPEFAEEGLHLTSAFQLAGFAHVVGSLWPVDDNICVDVAQKFYERLLPEIVNTEGDELNGCVARA
jgi:CHAT domain-containing protein